VVSDTPTTLRARQKVGKYGRLCTVSPPFLQSYYTRFGPYAVKNSKAISKPKKKILIPTHARHSSVDIVSYV
jgi:hypothetical protein